MASSIYPKTHILQYTRGPKPFSPYRKPIEIQGTAATMTSADEQGQHVADDRPHAFVGIDPADGAGGVVADAERRREQPDAHGEDHHHRVVHLVDADLAGDREQQRPEQHDGRNALEHAAEDDEGDDGDRQEHRRAARQAAMAAASAAEKPDWVSAQAMPVAAPMISRIAPDSAAVSISMGRAGASRTAGRSGGRPGPT